MRLFDKFITTWGNTIIKSLVIFSVIYICAMFIRVETLHSRFEKRLEQITINQSNIINEIKILILLKKMSKKSWMKLLKKQK